MALEIEHLNEHRLTGTLDGVLAFEVNVTEDGIFARISNWTRRISNRSVKTVQEMRALGYECLARYREDESAPCT